MLHPTPSPYSLLERKQTMARSAVTVLAYHRIASPDDPDLSPTVIDAYPADFEAQMRYVASRYNVVSSWDLVRALREGYTLPRRALIITFDDGYRSFKDAALPVLQRMGGLPASLFVVTHYVGAMGAPFWWDALYRALMRTQQGYIEVPGVGILPLETPNQRRAAYDRLAPIVERITEEKATHMVNAVIERCGVEPSQERYVLNWEEVEDLARAGVAVGAHTRHHVVLAQTSPDRVRSEIAGSWADLRARLPDPLPIFCYPSGKPHAVNAVAAQTVRQAGMVGAYTMVAGLNVLGNTNPYTLYRVGMEAGESLPRFAIKIAGAGRAYRKLKSLVSRKASAEFSFRE